jgi:polyisoprenyl-phosphate glycosyltransferase
MNAAASFGHDPSESTLGPGAKTEQFISIVVPVYNEQEVIHEFNRRLSAVRADLAIASEVIYVNDGSKDTTLDQLKALQSDDRSIGIIDLSRNFGKEVALTAGLDHSRGAAVIVIDADLQDPPELIPTLIQRWKDDSADVVFAQRLSRAGESRFKKFTAYAFYRVMNAIGGQRVPVDTGDFRLLSRRAVDALQRLRERHRFMKGLFAWIGFTQVAVPYQRDARFRGETKWNYWKLWNFSIEGITSFSIAPLKLSTYLGLVVALLSLIYGLYMIVRTIVYGNPVAGYPSLLVAVLFMGGIQLISLGIIGEYLGRVFNEAKQRPLYFTNMISPAMTRPGTAQSGLDEGKALTDRVTAEPPHVPAG